MLELRHVSASHGLHDFSLSLSAGERLVLLGPTGSGKTTLLRLIVGLETPTCGDIFLAGRRINHVPPHERGIAFLPQRPALYPHLTVLENLRIALPEEEKRRRGEEGKRGRVEEVAVLLKITALLQRRPEGLSGGEKQRVSLARLVLRNARLWLLDEPFAPLDPVFRAEFRAELHLLVDSLGATIILVSHDPIDALALGRLVGVLGDGRLQQLGTPEELKAHPGNRFVASALGQVSF